MRFLIVNRFFGGAQIPTGRMAEDVARVLVAGGHEVTALASSGAYEGAAQARDPQSERLTDQEAKRPKDDPPTRSPRQPSPAGQGALDVESVQVPKWMPRAVAWVWFTWQARKRIPRMDWDVCVLMTDPPLLPLLAPCAARRRDEETKRRKDEKTERRVAVWLMDLYPEALAASGRLSEGNPIYRWYFEKKQRALEACDLLICLGEEQTKRLETKRPKDQESQTAVAVVPPWDDRGNIALATEESLQNLALYAGNLGEAHCFEEILAAVPFLPADWRIRFAVRGAKLSLLKEKAKTIGHGLTRMATDESGRHVPTGLGGNAHAGGPPALAVSPPNELKSRSEAQTARGAAEGKPRDQETKRPGAVVEVTGYASEEETPKLLASARVHLITMSPGWEGVVVPSKLYGCIRTGRPVLFIGPDNADTAREILANEWGAVLPPGTSGEKVAAVILDLAARPTREVRLKKGAREVAEQLQFLATADCKEPQMAPRQTA